MTAKKRISCTDEACSFGKVCTNPLLRTVCSTSNHEMKSKEHVTTHRLLLERIHEFKSLEFSDSEQHNEEVRETKRGRAGHGNQEKNTHPKRKLAGTVAHQSLLIPNQIFLLWYQEVVLNIFILCGELVTLFLTIKRQPIAKFLNAGPLLLSDASFC